MDRMVEPADYPVPQWQQRFLTTCIGAQGHSEPLRNIFEEISARRGDFAGTSPLSFGLALLAGKGL